MKKKIIIFLIIIALLIGGGVVVWKLNQNKENRSSDNSPIKPSLSQLSDKELEKCLLEDFSRRLDLEKYFVFNLGKEVKTEKGFFNNKPAGNVRVVNDCLSKDLTTLVESLLKKKIIKKEIDITNYVKVIKRAITFCGKDINTVPDEWTGDNLDGKITNNKDWYIIFDKSRVDDERAYFTTISENGRDTNKLAWNGHVIVEIEKSGNYVAKSKVEALDFLKNNDPALMGKN